MDNASSSMHLVICPWLALGHLLPCLDIAERLASRGHSVSLVSTPRNIARLPPVQPELAALVDFVELPLPRVDGLPEGCESTNDIPPEKLELLVQAFQGLQVPFSEFLSAAVCGERGKKPDWVMVEIFHHWAAAAAIQHKVPCALLVLCPASVFATVCGEQQSAAAKLQTLKQQGGEEQLMDTEGATGVPFDQRFLDTLQSCKLLAVRSSVEWEPEGVPLLAKLSGKPVVSLGLLPPSPYGHASVGEDATLRWLNSQPAKSVVYVALGSEVPLPVAQVHELALGLELAGTRFLWALRRPSGGVSDNSDAADILPPGFEERTRGHGLVTTGWVPQISILAHGAVMAFLTHCGWSSIFEGLFFGHPLIMLPISWDQGPNALMMEGRKVGLQVPRDGNDASFDRQGIATTVSSLMAQKGFFEANAKKLQEIVADIQCHERYIDGFIQQLRCYQE